MIKDLELVVPSMSHEGSSIMRLIKSSLRSIESICSRSCQHMDEFYDSDLDAVCVQLNLIESILPSEDMCDLTLHLKSINPEECNDLQKEVNEALVKYNVFAEGVLNNSSNNDFYYKFKRFLFKNDMISDEEYVNLDRDKINEILNKGYNNK